VVPCKAVPTIGDEKNSVSGERPASVSKITVAPVEISTEKAVLITGLL